MTKRTLKVSTVLRRALKLIEAGWTRGAFAKAKNGRCVDASSSRAARFCAYGALRREARSWCNKDEAAKFLRLAVGTDQLADWNDSPSRKKTEVIKAFRLAYELARAAERAKAPAL